MDFLGRLASDDYQSFFPTSELYDLIPFCSAIASDAGSTAEDIKSVLLSAGSEQELTYEQCKSALLAHFSLGGTQIQKGESRKEEMESSSNSNVSTPEKIEPKDPLEKRFLELAAEGRVTLKTAMDLFGEWGKDRGPIVPMDISKFRELLLASEKPIMRASNRSPNIHRRYQSQPPQFEAVITFEDFKEALQKWESLKSATHSVAEKLKSSIQEYRQAIELLGDNQTQIKAIEGIIATLERQLQTFERPPAQDEALERQLVDQQAKSLQMIFSFYCKQQSNVGPKPTFEEITTSLTHWNLGKFVKFCIDFTIAGRSTESQKFSKEELKSIFLTSSSGHRKMSHEQFLRALDRIADRTYDAIYDSLHGTNVAQKSSEDKRALLYLELGLENSKQISEKMKRFGPALSLEKAGYRLPEDDLARKYRSRLKASQRPELQEWKARKATQSSGTSALRSSVDSSKFSYVPSDAIAMRKPAALNYSELYQQRHNAVSVTWQALSHMHYSDINVGDNIGELIGVGSEKFEDSDLLDKQYGLGKFSQLPSEPSAPHSALSSKQETGEMKRMEGLLKLHERKVNRGMKVLRRTNASKSVNNSVSNKM